MRSAHGNGGFLEELGAKNTVGGLMQVCVTVSLLTEVLSSYDCYDRQGV
jgi:hypothetical protein